MGGGGGKRGGGGGNSVVGYRYRMGVHLAVCHGPVDAFRRFVYGERMAWSGMVTDNATISIDNANLFGGDSREGGVQGAVDVLMGAPTQGQNDYLVAHQGANAPAYRGIFSLVFRRFLWSSGNPYFKAPWIEVTRILKGWHNDTPWNPEDAVINGLDMNPAHIIYQCFTDPNWGMGYSTSEMNDDNWRAGAATLKAEGFGMSLEWNSTGTVEDFVKDVLSHINGAVNINLATGKFELRLLRDDYDEGDLILLNPSNVLEMKSFQRSSLGDNVNELTVVYSDRDGNEKPITVQDLASIRAQGAVINTQKKYLGIRDGDLAAKVAMRDLNTLALPLAQAVLVVNRVLWNTSTGDVVKLTWPARGIVELPMRVISIDKGNLTSGKIEVTLLEDVFALPSAHYTVAPPTQWSDTVNQPVPLNTQVAIEAPYWEVVRNVSIANVETFEPGYGFGMMLTERNANQLPISYVVMAAADDTDSEYVDVGIGHTNPSGRLSAAIGKMDTTFTVVSVRDLADIVTSADGGYLLIDDEFMSIIDFDDVTGEITVGRGVLDTVPATHVAGSRVFFKGPTAVGIDLTERAEGETVFYRLLPKTGAGVLDIGDAPTEELLFTNRAGRPYPPGKVQVAGNYYPTTIDGPDVTVTWAHRDRLAQTVDFVDHTVGNIGPEPGTTYRLRLYDGNALLRTYDVAGTETSWKYPSADSVIDGNKNTLRVMVSSMVGQLESSQHVDHTFTRTAVTGGTTVETMPVTPEVTANSGKFSVSLIWDFRDTRTNVRHTEVWVSETPSLADATLLATVTGMTNTYTHNLETLSVVRYYWVRVCNTDGLLSPWSNRDQGAATPVAPPAAPSSVSLFSGTDQLTTLGDGTVISRIKVVWPLPSDPYVTTVEVQYRVEGEITWENGPVAPDASVGYVHVPLVMDGVSYEVRIRYGNGTGNMSAWTVSTPHTVVGKTAKPTDVPYFTINGDSLAWGSVNDLDLAGYRIKWNPNSSRDWGVANPLHEGLLQNTPYLMLNRPAGPVTLLIKAVDTSGNESENAAFIITDLGDPTVNNVIMEYEWRDHAWAGTIDSGAIDGVSGDIIATLDPSPAFWTNDAAAFWTNDWNPFWSADTFARMTYYPEPYSMVASTDVGANMTLAYDITGNPFSVYYRRDGAEPFWTDDDAPIWTSDTALFWAAPSAWMAWPGSIISEGVLYEFKVITEPGVTRGRIASFVLRLDVPDIMEFLDDVVISAGGSRLPITKEYRAIKVVNLTLQHDGGTAITVRVEDKSVSLGPLVTCRDLTNAAVAGKVDALIKGF